MPAGPCSASAGGGGTDIDAGCGEAVGIGAATGRRRSFSYHRLPAPLLRLSIRKLDGSSFDVQIARTAAVWELKVAVEGVFAVTCEDTGQTISWQHLWGHFCLCFRHQKLTDDRAMLRAFGIRDDDELHFVHHFTIDYSPSKRFSKNHEAAWHRRSMTSIDDFSEDDGGKMLTEGRHSTSLEELCVYDYNEGYTEQEGHKVRRFFRGWFSYSRLRNSRTHSKEVPQCSESEKQGSRSKLGKWLSSKNRRYRLNEGNT